MHTMLLQRKAYLIENWPKHFAFCKLNGLAPSLRILSSYIDKVSGQERVAVAEQYLDTLPNLKTLENKEILKNLRNEIASHPNYEEVIKILLRRACLINMFPKRAEFFADISIIPSSKMAEELLTANRGYSFGGDDLVLKQLAMASHLEARDVHYTTPLFKAIIQSGSGEPHPLCEILLKLGASVEPDASLRTGLMIAAHWSNNKICKLLLAYGVDPNADPGKVRESPLEDAVDNQNVPLIKMLLAAGANPYEKDTEKRTPLQRALAEENHLSASYLRAFEIMKKLRKENIYANFERRKEGLLAEMFPEEETVTRENAWNIAMEWIEENEVVLQPPVADRFALMVGVSADYYRVKENLTEEPQINAKRYLEMAAQLPIELQMALSQRTMGLPRDLVLTRHFNPAWNRLVQPDLLLEAAEEKRKAAVRLKCVQ